VVPALIGSFDKPGAAYAVLALKEIGSAAVPYLLKALSTPGAAYATLALKEIGATCVNELIQEFQGEGAAYAVLALKEIGPPAVQPLIGALGSPNTTIKMWAALALGEMGRWAQGAIPALTAACSDPSADVREAARDALKKIQ
jgi:HEAT repeat protein